MYLFCCTAGPGVTLCFPEKPDSLPHGERFRSWGNCPALPSPTFSWAFNLFIKLWLMAPQDTEGCTFRPSFRLLEEVQGKTSYSYSMPRKFNCSSFSFRVQGLWGASAASCFGLIEVKPPKHVGWFGNVATNAAPWGGGAGGKPEPGSLHIHFYKQLAPSQQLMGWEWCSCTKSFPEKKNISNCKHISAFLLGFVLSLWVN